MFKLPDELLSESHEDLRPVIERNLSDPKGLFIQPQTGTFRSETLFVETIKRDLHKPIYWLHSPNKNYKFYEKFKDLPSFRECFIKFGDVSGKVFSQYFLGGIDHLEYLLETFPWFRSYFLNLQNELYYTIRNVALKGVLEIARNSKHKQNYQALVFLASGKWSEDLFSPKLFDEIVLKATNKEKESIRKILKSEMEKLLEDASRLELENSDSNVSLN